MFNTKERCQGITHAGNRCKLQAMRGDKYCRHHYFQRYSQDTCFLCGDHLNTNRSDEHVFPKWLLKQYKLYNYHISLPNMTSIPYRNLVIPCCKECNNNSLSDLENKIRNALDVGYEEVKRLDELTIFQWLGKIFYGMIFRELTLFISREEPSKGTITSPEFINDFKYFHSFLQSIKYPIIFENFTPWSLFIFKIHEYNDAELDFDFSDSFFAMSVSIRLKGVGIIACLADVNQVNYQLHEHFSDFQKNTLHPIQFEEIKSVIFAQALLQQRSPSFVSYSDNEAQAKKVVLLPTMSLKPFFDDWDHNQYIELFSYYLSRYGFDKEQLVPSQDYVTTFLRTEDGQPLIYDKDGNRL